MENLVPQEQWLKTSQLQMRYLDWGDPADSRSDNTVLALHGLASSCHWYDLVIPRLTDSFRFISPDQRGHGKTDQPDTGYDWLTVSTDVIEAMDALGCEKAAVMGHSWGANVALAVAAKYPERVSKLVMIDGGYFDWTLRPGATWESFSSRLRPRDVSGTREQFLSRLSQQLSECWSDQLAEIVMSMVEEDDQGNVRDILRPSNHAQVMEAMWNEPSSTMFPNVRCPSLIVTAGPRSGSNSEFTQLRRQMAEAAEAAIADCRVEWIPDTMHDIGYHKPAELAQALRSFLSAE